jgi:hypothetical protein
MARKGRLIRAKCFYTPNKAMYGNRYEAEQKLAEIRRWYAKRADSGLVVLADTPTRAYLCESCGMWHLTSKEQR